MPAEWLLHVLEERLKRDIGLGFVLESVNVRQLRRAERDVVLDAVVSSGHELTVVLVNGSVACVGEIDPDAVIAAVNRS